MASAPLLAPGSLFAGDFLIERMLSEGGMGVVYTVEQKSTGKRRALKLMHPQLVADPKLRQRFEQEARVAARIESDHVVEIVTAGIDEASSIPYLAMELLEGEDLHAVLFRRICLEPFEVRELMSQLGHALGAAHRSGIVHRDLKPENLFIAKGRRPGVPFTLKVLDFGIAKVVAEAKTLATANLGTPTWWAPEQAETRAGITPATDVWAMGLIAFRLLVGRNYWKSANADRTSLTSLMREVLFDTIVPASTRAWEYGLSQKLPPGFDAWFAHCVCREPSGRFAEGASASESLDAILASFVATHPPPTHDASARPAGPSAAPPAIPPTPQAPVRITPPAAPPAQVYANPYAAPSYPHPAPYAQPYAAPYPVYAPMVPAQQYPMVAPPGGRPQSDPALGWLAMIAGAIVGFFGLLFGAAAIAALVEKGEYDAGSLVAWFIVLGIVCIAPVTLAAFAFRWGLRQVRTPKPS